MAAKPNLVPSKDALRALRSLALSPHVAVIGTLGSACGLAAIHYHERRKLLLAERILETRRTIHTLSRGKGVAKLHRMFEAAERGEDFTLHQGRPMKSQKRRQSTVAAPVVDDQPVIDFTPFASQRLEPDSTETTVQRKPSSRIVDDITTSDQLDELDEPPDPEYDLPTPSVSEFRHDSWNSFQYITQDARRAHRREMSQWREKEQGKEKAMREIAVAFEKYKRIPAVTDIHPVPIAEVGQTVTKLEDASTLSPEESIFFNFVFGGQTPGESRITDWDRAVTDWKRAHSGGDSPASTQSSAMGFTTTSYPDLSTTDKLSSGRPEVNVRYVPPGTIPPTKTYSHSFKSIHDYQDDETTTRRYTREPRYASVFNDIVQVLHDDGEAAAQAVLAKTMELYVSTGRKRDFKLVKLLIPEFTHYFEPKVLGPIIRATVRKALRNPQPRTNPVCLLYPLFGEVPRKIGPWAHFFAMQYLEETCNMMPEFEDQRKELITIVEGTLRCKVRLDESLVLPILRYQFSRGRAKEAQEILTEMQEKYGINITFYTAAELVQGFASTGNWWKVKAILKDYHENGYSWKKVYGYTGLFARALDEYMARHSIEKSCAFVMEAMSESGLFPTVSISVRVIMGCLRTRRYDLIRQYLNMVQRDYPEFSTGLMHAQFGSALATTWREMDATAEDVLSGCKALAVNAVRDPFSKVTRGTVSEAVSRDLYRRIRALEDAGGVKLPASEERPDVKLLTERIRQLVKYHYKIGFTTKTRALTEELVIQTKVVNEVDRVLSGSYSAEHAMFDEEDHEPVKDDRPVFEQPPRMPPGLRSLRLPDLPRIVSTLQKFYQELHDKGLPIDHSVLRYVVKRLDQLTRQTDAYALLKAVYHSEWAQPGTGLPYGIDIYTQWLRLAYITRSQLKVKEVMWIAVEADTAVRLTADFLLLARISLPRTMSNRDVKARAADFEEGEYLSARLRRRRAQEQSVTDTRTVVFGPWDVLGLTSS